MGVAAMTTNRPPRKSWIEVGTFLISVFGFCISSISAFLTYRIDSKTKAFDSNGYLDVDYFGVDLYNFCNSEDYPKSKESSGVRSAPITDELKPLSYNLEQGFIKNSVWREAKVRTSLYCERVSPITDESGSTIGRKSNLPTKNQNVVGYSLVFLAMTSQQSLYSISPTISANYIKNVRNRDIWKYNIENGQNIDIPLGPIKKGEAIFVPIAIIKDFKSNYRDVIVPKSVKWRNPITESTVQVPLDFIVEGEYWRSKQEGVTASGGPVLSDF
jgi:hypothetical protein